MAVSRDRGGGVSAARSRAGPCSAGSPLSGVSRWTWSCGHREQVRGLPRPASHTRKRGRPPLGPQGGCRGNGWPSWCWPGAISSPPPRSCLYLETRQRTWGWPPPSPTAERSPSPGAGRGGQHHMLFKAQVGPGGAWCRSWLCHLGVRVLICKMGCSEGPSPWGCKDCVSGATALWPWTDTSLEHRHHLHACAPQSHVCLVTALFVGCFSNILFFYFSPPPSGNH